MVKENVVLFTGKSDGLTWEKFDDSVVSWGRKKFGDAYAMALWKDELMNLRDLDMTDDLVKYAFEDYCDLVYDMLVQESPKYASDLYHDRVFGHQDGKLITNKGNVKRCSATSKK